MQAQWFSYGRRWAAVAPQAVYVLMAFGVARGTAGPPWSWPATVMVCLPFFMLATRMLTLGVAIETHGLRYRKAVRTIRIPWDEILAVEDTSSRDIPAVTVVTLSRRIGLAGPWRHDGRRVDGEQMRQQIADVKQQGAGTPPRA